VLPDCKAVDSAEDRIDEIFNEEVADEDDDEEATVFTSTFTWVVLVAL
jgi:hypothetical protein